MRPRLITGPTELPVTLAEAKAHIRVDYDDEDLVVEGFIRQAVAYLDAFSGVLGQCICTQTWAVSFEAWEKCINLGVFGVSNVSVTYLDENDAEQTLSADNYVVMPLYTGDAIWMKPGITEPRLTKGHPYPVTVQFDAGRAAADVSDDIKGMILDLVGHYDFMREAAGENTMHPVPYGFGSKLAAAKRTGI